METSRIFSYSNGSLRMMGEERSDDRKTCVNELGSWSMQER